MTTLASARRLTSDVPLVLLRASISAHGIFWLVIGVYYTSYMMLHFLRPDVKPTSVFAGSLDVITGSIMLISLCILLTFMTWLVVWLYRTIRYTKPEQPLAALWSELKQFTATSVQRIANGLPMVIIIAWLLFMSTDIQGKILTLNPTTWDVYFANLDEVLHFGYQPWQLLQPVFGHPLITFLLNLNYNIWFFVMWVSFLYFGFMSRPSELRTRFFLSFSVMWIVAGNLLAIIFSTGGPCYFSRLGFTPDPFEGLMTYLRNADAIYPVWALSIQDILWKGHVNDVPLSLISAMPSLHNAAAMLFALAAYQVNRFWGRLLAIHAIFIFIGSVHLAWHYAVDSYVSWALVLVIWFVMGRVARWWHSTAAQKDFDAMLAA